jgi:FkbM family methyltransferase
MTIRMNAGMKFFIRKVIKLFDFQDNYLNIVRKKHTTTRYKEISYTFSIPNKLCRMRAKSLATKEPETLAWIDSFPQESLLWDIGANVGIYSIYAAKARNCTVFSFEPSVFNLEVLARNVYLNNLGSLITIMPFAVNDTMGRGDLSMSTDTWGGALSTFDKTYGVDGKEFQAVFKYPIFSISLDDAITRLNLQFPDYIKIDVDGIEQLILAGGSRVLKHVKGVLIELPNLWQEQTDICEEILLSAGMIKTHNSVWHQTDNPQGSPNQIWERKPFNLAGSI